MEASESLGNEGMRGEAEALDTYDDDGKDFLMNPGDDDLGLREAYETSKDCDVAPTAANALAQDEQAEATQERWTVVMDEESASTPVEEGEGDRARFEANFPEKVEELSASEEELPRAAPDEAHNTSSDAPLDGEDENEDEGVASDQEEGDDSAEDAPMPPPAPLMNSVLSYELSRGVMFNKYAGATPSSQEQQSTAQTSSWVAFDDEEAASASAALPSDATHECSSVACQQLMRWKDARIQELQRALDQMVEAMAIQQRDLAAQRALLSRQSEHFAKLSMSLHQEKVAMQLSRERSGSAGRSRTQHSSSSAGIGADSRRGTMSHVHSLPDFTGRAKASVTIVEPPRAPARRSLMPSPPLPLSALALEDQPATQIQPDLREKSKSLSALEVRATTPQMPTIHEVGKFAADQAAVPPVRLCEVSLHDREPSTAASTGTSDSSSDLLHGDPQSSTPQPDSAKKWSLGGRLRSIRWKN